MLMLNQVLSWPWVTAKVLYWVVEITSIDDDTRGEVHSPRTG